MHFVCVDHHLTEVRAAEVGLLLAVALVGGSIQAVLEVVQLLLPSPTADRLVVARTVCLPASARRMLARYLEAGPSYSMKLFPEKVCGPLPLFFLFFATSNHIV